MSAELDQILRQALHVLSEPRQDVSLLENDEQYDESHHIEEALDLALVGIIPYLPDTMLQSLALDLIEQCRQARGSKFVYSTPCAGQIKDGERLLAWRPAREQAEQIANYCYDAGIPASVHPIQVDVERSIHPKTHPRYRPGTHTEETRHGVFVLQEHLDDEIIERLKAALFGLRQKMPPLVSPYATAWSHIEKEGLSFASLSFGTNERRLA